MKACLEQEFACSLHRSCFQFAFLWTAMFRWQWMSMDRLKRCFAKTVLILSRVFGVAVYTRRKGSLSLATGMSKTRTGLT